MERRTFLASVSASLPLSLAGCIGGQDDEPSQTTAPNDTTTASQTTQQPAESGPLAVGETAGLTDDRALSVVDRGASAFVVTRGDGEDRIHAHADERYVTVKFAPDGIDDFRSFVAENVALTVNGEHEFGDPVFPIGGGPSRFDAAYSIPTDLTPYTTTVSLDAGDASASWEFDARDIEAITQTVDYSVGSLSAPDSVSEGESFTAELPVENAGDEITFYAVLQGTANAPTLVSEHLPAGETTTIEIGATAPEASGDDDPDASAGFVFSAYWGHDDASTNVDYE